MDWRQTVNKKDMSLNVVDLESVFSDGRIVGGESVDMDNLRQEMATIILNHKKNKEKAGLV